MKHFLLIPNYGYFSDVGLLPARCRQILMNCKSEPIVMAMNRYQ
jgi:hypothetical protein